MSFYYIAGPLSGSDRLEKMQNVMRAVEAAALLRKNGIACVVPHLESLFNEDATDEDGWLAVDFEIITACEGLIVLPDYENSRGTLKEIYYARRLGVLVLSFAKILDQWNAGNTMGAILEDLLEEVIL